MCGKTESNETMTDFSACFPLLSQWAASIVCLLQSFVLLGCLLLEFISEAGCSLKLSGHTFVQCPERVVVGVTYATPHLIYMRLF